MEAESQPSAASKSEPQNDPGKMFVGGLSWQTSADGLREYFSKFGELKECVVMKDPISKRSRCFGFVTFADPAMVDKVVSSSHELDNKKVDPKPAIPKKPAPKMITKTKKIFVGGLSTNTKKEDIVEFFQQFGKITDTMLLIDKNTERSRGFGFVTFETEEIAEKVVEQQYYTIKEKRVEVKKAQPKEVMYSLNAGRGRAGRGIIVYPGFANYGRGYPGPGFGAGFGGYQLATYNAALATAFAAQGRGRGRGRGGAFMGAYGGGAMGYPGFHGRYMGPGEQRRNPGAVQGYYAEYATMSNPSGRVGAGTRPEVPHLNTVPEFPDYNRVQMNSYTQQQFGAPPHSPVSRGFGQATSPGPVVTQDMGYISSPGPGSGVDHVGYPSTSPQPAGFGPGMAY